MRVLPASVIVACLVLIAGCTTPGSGPVYSRNEVNRAWTVAEGRVIDVVPVQIEGESSVIGTAGGGYVGYEVGRSIGSGSGRDIAGAVGTVVGATAGRAVEKSVTRQDASQITVQLDRGEAIAIVQSAALAFQPGERVRVLRRGDGAARVAKL